MRPPAAAPRRDTFDITPDHAAAAEAELNASKQQFLAENFEEAARSFEASLELFPIAAFAFQLGVTFRDIGRPPITLAMPPP